MSSATLSARRNQNLYRQPTTIKLGPISGSFITIALIGLLALLYLGQVTKTTVLGYKVGELTRQHDQLTADRKDMSVEAARLQSIQRISGASATQGLVAAGRVTYAK